MIGHERLGYVEDGSSQREVMSGIASYSSSFLNHSLRTALHFWTPDLEHQILSGHEGSMSKCTVWGGDGVPISDWSVGGRSSSKLWEMEAVVSWMSTNLARHAVSWDHE